MFSYCVLMNIRDFLVNWAHSIKRDIKKVAGMHLAHIVRQGQKLISCSIVHLLNMGNNAYLDK